jgi:hypothetical protein
LVKKSHPIKQPIRITQNFKMKTKNFKIILTILFILFAIKNGFSQTNNKDVTITSSGSGKTLENAKQAALRSATEQAYGAFISSKTEMFNDQVVADQMASVSSGNIKSYEVLNESQLPDGSWGVTLKALVSVDKLTSFVEAKGIAIEIKGGMFALNIKQQSLNELGEVKAVSTLVGLLHEPMQISFDYIIKSSDPKSLDAENKNWEIPLVVTATTNKNMDFCAKYCIKTLAALSLSSEEVTSYKSLNKSVFPIKISYGGVVKTFYLRKQGSINALNTLISQWEFYTRLFTVQSGLDESYGNGEGQIHAFSSSRSYNDEGATINFPTTGQKAATFSWQDKRTLAQIEQMTGYKVKPRGVFSQFKHGGFVVYDRDGYVLIAAITDLGQLDWNSAQTACDGLILNGYSDWRLPSKKELNMLYVNFKQFGVGGFTGSNNNRNILYWSDTYGNQYCGSNSWIQDFDSGIQLDCYKGSHQDVNLKYNVRAVRTFSSFKTGNSLAVTTTQLAIFTRISDNSTIYINANESLEIFSLNPNEDTWKAKYKNIEGTIKSIYLNQTSEYLAFENNFLVN